MYETNNQETSPQVKKLLTFLNKDYIKDTYLYA